MKPACPKCHAVVEYLEHGGLVSFRCPVCGWHEEGTVNRPIFPPIELGTALVAKAVAPISAAALKAVREECKAASAISLETLRQELTSAAGLWLGNLPAYRDQGS